MMEGRDESKWLLYVMTVRERLIYKMTAFLVK